MRNPFYDLLAGENSPRRQLYLHEEPMDISLYFGTGTDGTVVMSYDGRA